MVVCTMSMDLMGIKSEELIDGIEEGGVAMYVDHLTQSSANMFIS
jgi:peroxiredoxin family protein